MIADTKNAFLGTRKNTYGMHLMQNLKEDLVGDLFRTGAIKAFSVEIREGQALIHYKMLDGTPGCIHTKRGQPKEYRIETALRFLRALGVADVSVQMSGWAVGQKGLGF